MDIEIEAIQHGVRFWREFGSPTEARKWARGPDVTPLVVRHGGHAVSLSRFVVDAVIARWDPEAKKAIEIEFSFN